MSRVLLSDLLQQAEISFVPVNNAEADAVSVEGIATDNRDVESGYIFIALKGEITDGHRFIADAARRGAVTVISDGNTDVSDSPVPVFVVNGLKEALKSILQAFYSNTVIPELCGVTGTNGKTSITRFIAQAAATLGKKYGLIGTLGTGIWPDVRPVKNTTPELAVLLRELEGMGKDGAEHVAMEVSSHGIAEGRIDGLTFSCAVFSNLSRDHLDFHGSMESYYGTKRQLFLSPALKTAVINIDDEYGQRLFCDEDINARRISYGFSEKADARVIASGATEDGVWAAIVTPWGEATLKLPLTGQFNIANALAALCVLMNTEQYELSDVVSAMVDVSAPAGRMESFVKDNRSPKVVIDFAHTPEALSTVLKSVSNECSGRIGVVFGCGGNRDHGKRALMGEAADAFADCIWLTADNPRTEDAADISEQIAQGIHNTEFGIITDRREAIQDALGKLSGDDLLLIAGKGHETYQEINNVKHEYSDLSVVAEFGYRKINQSAGGEA